MVFAVHSTVPTVVMMIVPEELPPPEKGMLLEAAEHTMGRSSRRPCSGQWLHLAVLIMCAGSPFVQGQSTTAPAATAATAPLTTPAPPTNIPQSFACFNCLFQPDGVTPKVVRAMFFDSAAVVENPTAVAAAAAAGRDYSCDDIRLAVPEWYAAPALDALHRKKLGPGLGGRAVRNHHQQPGCQRSCDDEGELHGRIKPGVLRRGVACCYALTLLGVCAWRTNCKRAAHLRTIRDRI
eukprot:2373951-Rhodomonas_salina.1